MRITARSWRPLAGLAGALVLILCNAVVGLAAPQFPALTGRVVDKPEFSRRRRAIS